MDTRCQRTTTPRRHRENIYFWPKTTPKHQNYVILRAEVCVLRDASTQVVSLGLLSAPVQKEEVCDFEDRLVQHAKTMTQFPPTLQNMSSQIFSSNYSRSKEEDSNENHAAESAVRFVMLPNY